MEGDEQGLGDVTRECGEGGGSSGGRRGQDTLESGRAGQ